MKIIITTLSISLILTSCIGAGNMSRRETIPTGANTDMVFCSDKTTLRTHNIVDDPNVINAQNKNITFCKAIIAADIFNAIEDSSIECLEDFNKKKSLIGLISDDVIKRNIDKSLVIYDKTTKSNDNIYKSEVVVELKKSIILDELKASFIKGNIADSAKIAEVISATNKRLIPIEK
ncbi:MAG: hypothetical protein RR908_00805 [Rikenellaceae bacterium]